MGVLYIHSPKMPNHLHYIKKKVKKILKIAKKGGPSYSLLDYEPHQLAMASCQLAAHECLKLVSPKNFLLLPTHIFLHMWSTLVGWLQHMPALPRLLLKFSNTHNFWSIGPKIMKFVLPQSLLQGTCSQFFLKI